MLAPIACGKRAWRSFGRLSGSQPSVWFWAWSWDPLKFMRRHPPHHLSPARANHPAGQDPEARLSRPSHHSNAPISPESQSILSKIVALTPSNGSFAVGTRVTSRPPHRSVRAQFGHTAWALFVKEASRHFCRPLSFHSFVRP